MVFHSAEVNTKYVASYLDGTQPVKSGKLDTTSLVLRKRIYSTCNMQVIKSPRTWIKLQFQDCLV